MLKKKLGEIHKNILNYPYSIEENNMLYNTQELYDLLSKKEEVTLLSNKNLRTKAVKLALDYGRITPTMSDENSSLNKAKIKMDELDIQIQNNLNGFYRKYALQWGLSVKALWFYKKKDYSEALFLTKKCIDVIDELVENGMYSLVFRGIEQNKNISTIYSRLNQKKECESLNGDILNYLFLGSPGKLYGIQFMSTDVWNEMPYLRESFGNHFFKDYLLKLCTLKSIWGYERKEKYFLRVFQRLGTLEVINLERYIIFCWLELQESFYKGAKLDFIEKLQQFLSQDINRFYDCFKEILLQQLISIINESNYNYKSDFIQKIEDYKNNKFSKLDKLAKIKVNGVTRKAKIE